MLFPDEDAPLLKAWIVKRLENTLVYSSLTSALQPQKLGYANEYARYLTYRSDADADVLAEYVLALLQHDGDAETIRKLCEDEIPDFLKEGQLGHTTSSRRLVRCTLLTSY
jgi:RNA-binding protein 26